MNENIIKVAIITCAILVFVSIPAMLKMKFNVEGKRLYKQGMEYYNAKDYSNAYYNFKQVKRYSNIYSFALLKQFQCANNLQDKKTASKTLRELIKIVKDDNIRPYLLYNDAILSSELNIDSDTKSISKFKYIIENYENNDFSYASSFRYAKLIEKQNIYMAKEKYIDYLSYAPTGKFAKEALSALDNFETFLTPEDSDIIANAYFENSNYENALKHFKKSKFEKNWVKISKCQRYLGYRQEEIETIKTGFSLIDSSAEEKELSYAVDRFVALLYSNKSQGLESLSLQYPNSYLTPSIEYKLAENINSDKAIKLYEDIIKNHSDSMWASNALWETIWYYYKQKRYKTCERLYELYFDKHKNSIDAPRISYWYAKALSNEDKNAKSKETFSSVMNKYPLSFYAFLSARQLRVLKSKRLITKKPISHYNISSINGDLFKNSTLLLLAEYDDWQTIDDLKIGNEYIKAWVLYKKGQYPLSITTAKKEYEKSNTSSFSDWQLKLMYPIVYEDLINKTTKKYERSPYLFLSLIREESHFDKKARSSVGALGLSQIMPSTANFITKTQISRSSLLDEENNIDIGLKYYTYLVDYFKGNEFLAIMSYNAGPGNINKWLKTPITDTGEIDMFIENIPFLETKNYIKKILSAYWVYTNIY